MKTHIYINFLKDDQLHVGVNLGNGYAKERDENIKDTSIVGSMKIHLGDSVPKTLEMFSRVIDEGFEMIGIPEEGRDYCEETKTGRFEFLTRSPFPKNATEAKAAIAIVFELTKRPIPEKAQN